MRQQDCSVVTDYGGNKFGGLYDVAIGVNDEVVIVDGTNNCVIVLDSCLALLSVIGQGSDEVIPYGVAVSKDDIIAVSYWSSSYQVKKYFLQGKLLSVIGNNRGSNNGQFNRPSGLAFSSNKMLCVVDRWNYRVQVFQQDDKFAFTFGIVKGNFNPGQFQDPIRIAIDTDNRVLVSDCDGNHISLFSHTGSFIRRITCDSPWAITLALMVTS
ncbi:E3 ubiquitin-protein ligase TRIM71-like [Dysidea avara]|uniref:E3 ubiquitin-protein ligase TRIM71-like n=1 Tax=Dysidea avara TaxID=196820 RepID=UPI00332369C9